MNRADTIEFFFAHAGYGYSEGIESRCEARYQNAVRLTDVESWVRDNGMIYTWDEDQYDSSEWLEEFPAYPQFCCALLSHDEHTLQSLGCIDFGRDRDPWSDTESRNYRRIVEAELALMMNNRNRAIGKTLGVSHV